MAAIARSPLSGARVLLRRYPTLAGVAGRIAARDLTTLARIHGTDKWGYHWYTRHYQTLFGPWRRRRFNLLEIGVGGYQDSRIGGESLRMWRDFFPRARIIGLDIEDKSRFAGRRIEIVQGDQSDPSILQGIAATPGGLSIVIDDGSHLDKHVLASFATLFPLLRSPGFYAIEDMEFSWRNGGDTVRFVESLVTSINYQHAHGAGVAHGPQIAAVHLFPNLVVIAKGENSAAH